MARIEHHKNKSGFQEKKILIVSEDSKSFPSYFKKILEEFGFQYVRKDDLFRKTNSQSRESIIVKIEHIDNCLKVVSHADSQSKKFYRVYCIFDDLRNQKDCSYEKAISFKTKENVVKINSSPSYEFWLVLHFSKSDAGYLNDEKLIKKLEELVRKIGGKKDFKYSKSDFPNHLFELVLERLPDAIKNAKAIEKSNLKTNAKSPSTKIYQLIEDFKNEF
jgi:hypothetical protein